MAFSFYEASQTISQTPKEYFRESYKNVVNDLIESASTYANIKEQTASGSNIYKDIKCRLTSLIDPKTGNNFGDQYRKIIFDDWEHEKWIGQYYQIDNEYWLATNTSTKLGASASSILRFCNNSLKWIDEQGVIKNYPCVFSRDISSENMKDNSSGVNQIWGTSLIQVQRNEDTNKLKFNDRLIFDGIAFQIQQINNHISDTYIEFYIFESQIQDVDDTINNIAKGNTVAPVSGVEIKILPDITSLTVGKTQQFSVYKYVDGVANSDTFTITGSGTASFNYNLNVETGNIFSITCNQSSKDILQIRCVNNTTSESVSMFIKLNNLW